MVDESNKFNDSILKTLRGSKDGVSMKVMKETAYLMFMINTCRCMHNQLNVPVFMCLVFVFVFVFVFITLGKITP